MITPKPVNVNNIAVKTVQIMITVPPANPDDEPTITYSDPIAVPQFDDGRHAEVRILYFTGDKT